jgi:uncharacterized membrane protein
MTANQVQINKKIRLHFALLFVACIVATFLSGPSPSSMPLLQWLLSGLFLAAISILPLLFFIPTVRAPNARNLSWLGFFLLAYLVWGVVKTVSPQGLIGGLLICTFILTTFYYTVVWLRPLKKAAKEKQKMEQEQD